MQYLIGLDIGTSSIKGVLVSTEGVVKHTAREAFAYQKPSANALEVSTQDFLSACLSAIRQLADAAEDGAVLAVCASSASGNLVVLDENMEPATAVINWQDQRVCDEAHAVLGELDTDALYRRMGWPFDYQTFPLAQLCYIKKHQPDLLPRCGQVCMSTEYLYYVLTGKWGISTSAGTPFYLIDQQTGTYVSELLDVLGVDESKVPPVMPCGAVLGGITEEMEAVCGLPSGTPVVLGSFDHPSAARGVGVLNEGEVLLSCGTSWVGLFPVKDRDKAADAELLIDPFLAPKGGCWATMSSVPSVSERLWLYISRYIDSSDQAFSILSSLAAACEPGAGGLSICPYDEPDDAKILSYSKEQIARAIMEGMVYQLKERLEELAMVGVSATSAVMVGGPSGDPMWHKLIHDICGLDVTVIHGAFAGAVGAAALAGIGVGLYENEQDAFSKMSKGRN